MYLQRRVRWIGVPKAKGAFVVVAHAIYFVVSGQDQAVLVAGRDVLGAAWE